MKITRTERDLVPSRLATLSRLANSSLAVFLKSSRVDQRLPMKAHRRPLVGPVEPAVKQPKPAVRKEKQQNGICLGLVREYDVV